MFSGCQLRKVRDTDELSSNMQKIEIIRVAGGNYCGIEQGKNIVINRKEEWNALWKKLHHGFYPQPALPDIDFSRETILAVFMGTRSTGGYSIEISNIKEHEGKITAIIETESPEPGEMVTMALSQPYHIVKINIAEKDIEFKKEK